MGNTLRYRSPSGNPWPNKWLPPTARWQLCPHTFVCLQIQFYTFPENILMDPVLLSLIKFDLVWWVWVAPVRLSSVLRPLEDKKSMSESGMEFELCVILMCAAFYKNSFETFAMKRPLVRTADAGTPTRTSSSVQPPPLPSNWNYLVTSILTSLDLIFQYLDLLCVLKYKYK